MPPENQTPQNMSYPTPEVTPPTPVPTGTTPADKKKPIIITIVVVLAVLLLATGAFLLFRPHKTAKNQTATMQNVNVADTAKKLEELGKKGNLSEADLAGLDKTGVFFTMFKKQNMQPVIQLKSYRYLGNGPEDAGSLLMVEDKGFDYRSKQIATRSNVEAGGIVGATICQNGVEYSAIVHSKFPIGSPASAGIKIDSWGNSTSDATTQRKQCGDANGTLDAAGMLYNVPGDGVAAGGMTAAQADAFVQSLTKYDMVHAKDLKLATHAGKQYLRLDVSMVPQKLQDNHYWGMQIFTWSFKDTGLDPATQPYKTLGTSGEGLHAIYYIDPATQLPVYASLVTTPTLDDQGQPKHSTPEHAQLEYQFPARLTQFTTNNKDLIILTWLDQEK